MKTAGITGAAPRDRGATPVAIGNYLRKEANKMFGKKKKQIKALRERLTEEMTEAAEERKVNILLKEKLKSAQREKTHLLYRLGEQDRIINELKRDRDVMGREVARLNEALHRTRVTLSTQHLAQERKKVFKGAALLRQRIRRLLDENERLRGNLEALCTTIEITQDESLQRFNNERYLRGKLEVYERIMGELEGEIENDDRASTPEVQGDSAPAERESGSDEAAEGREVHSGDDVPREEDFGEPGAAEDREEVGGEESS